MVTSLGLVFLPLCLFFWRRPARLLELVFVGAAFAAAAVIAIGGYGISPGLIPTALFIVWFVIKTILGARYPAEKIVVGVLFPFILVTAWAVISSFLMPRFFEGQIPVWPQKASLFFNITPLAPNSGNYTQDLYLLAASLLTMTASLYITRSNFDFQRLMNAYFFSNLMVDFISLWQFASNLSGLWFPTNFFLSNPGWALLSDETVGSIIRITGPFSEPAALATYLCGAIGASAWVVLNGHKGVLPRVVLVSSTLIVLMSTAATGYAALALMLFGIGIYTVIFGNARLRGRVLLSVIGAGIFIVACFIVIPAVTPHLAKLIEQVTFATLNKQSTSSYSDRTSTDVDSMRAALQSYGLGVGWGSNRSSSLIPGLLASVGIWGILGLCWFMVRIAGHVKKAHQLARSSTPRKVMHACTGAILGTLSASVLSAPSITSPDFFLLLALLIGTAGRVRFDARYAQSSSVTHTPLPSGAEVVVTRS